MSIQVYSCGEDGDFELFTRVATSVSPTETCPTCGGESPHVFRPGGRINIIRTWNDRANDEQKNSLTKVTASQDTFMRHQAERDLPFKKKNTDDLYKVAVKVEENDRGANGT